MVECSNFGVKELLQNKSKRNRKEIEFRFSYWKYNKLFIQLFDYFNFTNKPTVVQCAVNCQSYSRTSLWLSWRRMSCDLLFYKKFIDDSINRREKNKPDELFNKLNSYHQKIKFTIKITPKKFLRKLFTRKTFKLPFIEVTTNYQTIGTQKYQKSTSEMQSTLTSTDL